MKLYCYTEYSIGLPPSLPTATPSTLSFLSKPSNLRAPRGGCDRRRSQRGDDQRGDAEVPQGAVAHGERPVSAFTPGKVNFPSNVSRIVRDECRINIVSRARDTVATNSMQHFPNTNKTVCAFASRPDMFGLQGMDRPEPLFSSVVFNGSLQFFRDPPKALSDAAEWLVDGGHIVVAHVQVRFDTGIRSAHTPCRDTP